MASVHWPVRQVCEDTDGWIMDAPLVQLLALDRQQEIPRRAPAQSYRRTRPARKALFVQNGDLPRHLGISLAVGSAESARSARCALICRENRARRTAASLFGLRFRGADMVQPSLSQVLPGLLGPVPPRCPCAGLAPRRQGSVRGHRLHHARRARAGGHRGARARPQAGRDGVRGELPRLCPSGRHQGAQDHRPVDRRHRQRPRARACS